MLYPLKVQVGMGVKAMNESDAADIAMVFSEAGDGDGDRE